MSPASKKTAQPSDVSASLPTRPPVVVVMGHVDHGKTTLLDFLRKSKIAEKEAGGITQSIGAYEVEKDGQRITFIDTPGHEAFSKMRQRGALIADLAVMIVAADDGVKPQTKEVIEILNASKLPFVVAINKIDKNNADPERTKNDLATNGVYLEKLGGDVPWVEISAKEGGGIDELLDTILLMWEMLALTYDPHAQASGFILESRRDKNRGPLASVIIKNGTLKVGDSIATPTRGGKVRGLENFLGKKVDALTPSSPALVLGFEDVPAVGDPFIAGELDLVKRAELFPQVVAPKEEEVQQFQTHEDENAVHIILRADVAGSLEALSQIITAMKIDDREMEIVSQAVGDITDGDVRLAQPTHSLVVGFNVKATKAAENVAKSQKTKIIVSNIIYRIVEALEEEIKHRASEEEGGTLEVLKTFSQQGRKQVIGGKMVTGIILLNDHIYIEREGERIGQGRVTNLQQDKKDCKRVQEGECGMMIETTAPAQVGDRLVAIPQE